MNGSQYLEERFSPAQPANKLTEGHIVGCIAEKLNILTQVGMTLCHESLNSEDVMERIGQGYCVILRLFALSSTRDRAKVRQSIKKSLKTGVMRIPK